MEEGADCIVKIVNENMFGALRLVSIEQGYDPRDFALVAFGGAGPLHAAAIADALGIKTVLCPRTSGVLAALGLVVSPRRRDVQRTVMLSGDELSVDAVDQLVAELGERAREALGEPDAELRPTYEVRYRGQAFELAIRGEPGELRDAFEAAHEERYGYRDPNGELELVTVRVSAIVPGAEVELEHSDDAGAEIAAGETVELPESTVFVADGWSAVVQDDGSIRMTR
jgi:N-methylhydantoinase A